MADIPIADKDAIDQPTSKSLSWKDNNAIIPKKFSKNKFLTETKQIKEKWTSTALYFN